MNELTPCHYWGTHGRKLTALDSKNQGRHSVTARRAASMEDIHINNVLCVKLSTRTILTLWSQQWDVNTGQQSYFPLINLYLQCMFLLAVRKRRLWASRPVSKATELAINLVPFTSRRIKRDSRSPVFSLPQVALTYAQNHHPWLVFA